MVVADLHAHTTVSDGTFTLESLVATARDAGLEAAAVTDHDRIHPELNAPVVDRDGLTVVRGIELRVELAGGDRVDLLGYGVGDDDALRAECERLQADRIDRGRRIIERVESRLGVDLGIEAREGLGRPHVARAIDASDADYDYEGAFAHLIGNDGPCYVPRDVTPIDRGVDLLRGACAVVGLAHPFRYHDPAAALDLCVEHDLDAVERFYPYAESVTDDPGRVESLAAEHDLLLTGGTDAHGEELGVAGLDAERWAAVVERLPEARS
ncbi:PHP domain-containing protein [Halobaculum sp. CBA1158]|uniref:PHP domain-containing protein n=1 Tax=Halobaculum sp. CBA1158 TaxID=2904243 RepID=UPI001F3B57E0|nr:PHP domain-containing protein [Halobaculum sp. CBA1158]UIO99706.1 PHP domain-containing protein [Halobaculum sp. CBA1158]